MISRHNRVKLSTERRVIPVLSRLALGACLPSLPEIGDNNHYANQYHCVCYIENSNVERSNTNKDQVSDKAFSGIWTSFLEANTISVVE